QNVEQFSYLTFIFIAFYVIMMSLQTIHIAGWEQVRRGTFLITIGMITYEVMDIRYLFDEALGREPDSMTGDLLYLVLVLMMTAGVTIQVQKRYVFDFRRRRYTKESMRMTVIVCLIAITADIFAVVFGLLHAMEATYIIITLLAYIIMGYILYTGEWSDTQNEVLEKMVRSKTRELTLANLQLTTAKAAAEEATKAKSDFLANMSHEIRTPINTILGMDELILRETNDPVLRKYAINIQRAGNALLSQINDVLDFSKIEAGKMELVPDGYNLALLIADMVGMVNARATAKGLEFKTEVNEDIPHSLFGDAVRIAQVIVNLLTNAVKYTREGSVTLSVDYRKVGDDAIDLAVAVKDTGIGIREEDIEKLFRAFERIDQVRNRTIEGTGLGMNIVTRLLEMMESHLEVQSEYGKGSCFSFVLCQEVLDWEPIGKFEHSIEDLSEQQEKYRLTFIAPEAKVLLVDDTEMNLMVTKGLLKNTQLQIDTAADGKQALSMAA
ncbi:MAG: hypothetical protein IJT32_02165, partial [Lachnospiraceae bacterium]|nr:hypothetical protein [Lachnospiraceae bacterium]